MCLMWSQLYVNVNAYTCENVTDMSVGSAVVSLCTNWQILDVVVSKWIAFLDSLVFKAAKSATRKFSMTCDL